MTLATDNLTVLILTFNEQDNIERIMSRLDWARRVLVVDSLSSDQTCKLLESYPNVTVVSRAFDTHACQWNFGLSQVTTPWVLTLDADYMLPHGASKEIAMAMQGSAWGYRARFEYCLFGKRVMGSLLPGRTVLFRITGASYYDDGHTQRLQNSGPRDSLPFTIAHDDRKPLARWLQSQVRYAQLEAMKIGDANWSELGLNDRLRKLLFVAPAAVFLLVYVLRGGFLSGWRGLYYALQRLTAEWLLSLFLVERIIRRKNS